MLDSRASPRHPGATSAHEGKAARTVNQGPETEIRHREFLEKHCVLGRNYHLQDIQLSKNVFAERPENLLVFLARVFTREKLGGEYRARTGDLLVANQALSQLS